MVDRKAPVESDVKGSVPPVPFRFGLSRRWLAIGLAAVLVLAVMDVVLVQRTRHAESVDVSRADATKSASKRVPEMLSYSYKTLDADLAKAKKNTTGNFRKDYATLLSKVVAPNAKDKQITTDAVVTGSSVVKASADKVVVLLFLTQSTQGAKGTTPLVSGSRVNVTMTKSRSDWLVSALTPV